MKFIHRSSLTLGLAAISFGAAQAQGLWDLECVDPANTSAFSTPYNLITLESDLIGFTVGTNGTVGQGDTDDMGLPVCFDELKTTNSINGRFAFGVPGGGSVQSPFDDGMALTMGWQFEPSQDYTYAVITGPDGDPANGEVFGDSAAGITTAFIGASDRYAIFGSTLDLGGQIQLEVRILADAVRLKWKFVDTDGLGGFGLVWVMSPWMRINGVDYQGFNQANTLLTGQNSLPKATPEGYMGFNAFDDGRPMRTSKRRFLTDSNFPKYVRTLFGQTDPYGLQQDMGANPSTPKASQANFVKVGGWGDTAENNMTGLTLFGDPTGTQNDNDVFFDGRGISTIVRYSPQNTGFDGTAEIVHYIKSTWSVGFYDDPYTMVVDAPRALHFNQAAGGLEPDPMTFRVWIDNQYATIDEEVPLFDVSAQIDLPAGFSLAPGETQVKNIARIDPNEIQNIDWNVVSDGETFGELPVSITVKTTPGPTKTITRTVRVGAAPVMSLVDGPNMLGFPYQFGDSSLDNILGLTSGVDFVAYQWDPALRTYVPTTNIQRGMGYWVIPNSAQPSLQLNNANVPTDLGEGGLLVNLKPGWNLISNPYNYSVKIRQLVGVSEDDNTEAMTWTELVQRELVSSSLTYFVPNASLPGGGSYALQPDTGEIRPHLAYWVFCGGSKDLRLIWPPLFEETLPNSGRAVDSFAQNDREWRLQLSARSTAGIDTQNYIGVVTDNNRAKTLQVPKAPEAPGSKLELAVLGEMMGQPTRMAQVISNRAGRQDYQVQVTAKEAGDVTVTWPNLPSLPRNLRVKLEDTATGEKRDLRATSGYTFRMDQPGTRVFNVTVEQAGSSRPVIGNVIVTNDGRDVANSPITINYSLSADALVTVRVLSSTGKEVFTVTRGRSDSAGENSATWTLRDNANRAVAPGTYNVEISAETPNGERVRKIVPVNVIR